MAAAALAGGGAGVRLRVEFDDPRGLLSKSQRREGLGRSWLLLRSEEIATIGLLAGHIRRTFGLQDSCPHGLVLSMDDFVLPLTESTRLLKENDVIRVRRKKVKSEKVLESHQNELWLHSVEHKEHPITHQAVHVETAEAHKNLGGHLVERRELEPLDDASFGGDQARKKLKRLKKMHGYDDDSRARDNDDLDTHVSSGKEPRQQSGMTSLEEEQENSQLNGIASKKTMPNHSTENITSGIVNNVFDSGPSEKHNAEGGKLLGSSIDFERLQPLYRLPKAGDIIAYRLSEPSTWGSQLSPFRVGKVSLYDSITKDIVVIPVPEYPIFPLKNLDGELDLPSKNSQYKEDGSMKIEYSFLIDVRLLTIDNPEIEVLNGWDVSVIKESRPDEGVEQGKPSEAATDCWNQWLNDKPTNQPSSNNKATDLMPTQFGSMESGNVCATEGDPVSTWNNTGSKRRGGRGRGRRHGRGRGWGRDNSASFGGGYESAPGWSKNEQKNPTLEEGEVHEEGGEQTQQPTEEKEAQQSGWEARTNKWNPWPQPRKPTTMPSWQDRVESWMLPPDDLVNLNAWNNMPLGLNIFPGSAAAGRGLGLGLETLYGAAARGRARGRGASSYRGRGRGRYNDPV